MGTVALCPIGCQPTCIRKRERQAGQHCYLKTLIWCLSLQVTRLRCRAQSRSENARLQPELESARLASGAAGSSWTDPPQRGRIPFALARGRAPAARRQRRDRAAGSRAGTDAGGTGFAHVRGTDFGREKGPVSPFRVASKTRSWVSPRRTDRGHPRLGVALSFPLPAACSPAQRRRSPTSNLLRVPGIQAAHWGVSRLVVERRRQRPSPEPENLKRDFLSLSSAEAEAFAFPK